jgi:hypothetical protein
VHSGCAQRTDRGEGQLRTRSASDFGVCAKLRENFFRKLKKTTCSRATPGCDLSLYHPEAKGPADFVSSRRDSRRPLPLRDMWWNSWPKLFSFVGRLSDRLLEGNFFHILEPAVSRVSNVRHTTLQCELIAQYPPSNSPHDERLKHFLATPWDCVTVVANSCGPER